MDFEALIKTQQEWLNRAVGSLGKTESEAPVPDDLREESARLARARLERLQAQRSEIVGRLDAAIAQETEVIARIEKLPGGDTRADAPAKLGKPTRQTRTTKGK